MRRRLSPYRFRLLDTARTTGSQAPTSRPSPSYLLLYCLLLLKPLFLFLFDTLFPLLDHLLSLLLVLLVSSGLLPAASRSLSALRSMFLLRPCLLQLFDISFSHAHNWWFFLLLLLSTTTAPASALLLSLDFSLWPYRHWNTFTVRICLIAGASILFSTTCLHTKVLTTGVYRHMAASGTETNLLGHSWNGCLTPVATTQRFYKAK